MVRVGEPLPKGCGSSMTRTSTPWLAASSNARITLRSDSIYISNQTDFLAASMALVIGCSPASGSTNTWTPWVPEPVLQLLWHPPDVLVPVEVPMEYSLPAIDRALLW